MKIHDIVRALEDAAQQLGMQVRKERGGFRGGRCTVGDETFVLLNRRHPPEVHLALLAESLREMPVDEVFLRPAVRNALEDYWSRRQPLDVEAVLDAD